MGVAVGSGAAQVSYSDSHPAGARKGWEPQYKKQQLDIYFTNDTTTVLPQPLYATDESGTGWKQSYVYGANDERISMSYLPSSDESTDWEPVADASGVAPNTTPETLYYLEDSLDSVLALLNNDDEVALRYHYDAFGVATDSEKFDLNYPGPDNLFGYTGLGYDASSGLSYARARYFDSSIGRFISQDTYEGELNSPLSLNLYTYVENNPLRYTDPSGHTPQGGDWAVALLDFAREVGAGSQYYWDIKNLMGVGRKWGDVDLDRNQFLYLFNLATMTVCTSSGSCRDSTSDEISLEVANWARAELEYHYNRTYLEFYERIEDSVLGIVGSTSKAGNTVKGWIKKETYKETRERISKEAQKKFASSMNKGFVGGIGENGIKKLKGNGIDGYMYEIKIKGKGGTWRLLGNYDEKTGHIIFDKLKDTH